MTAPIAYNLESERLVIGGVLVHPTALIDCVGLESRHFYPPHHQAVWDAIRACDLEEVPIDRVTVTEAMRHAGTFDVLRAVGGAEYLNAAMGDVVTVENIGYHVGRVKQDATRRQWERWAVSIAAAARDEALDAEAFLDQAQRGALELTTSLEQSGGPRPVAAIAKEVITNLEKRSANRSDGGVTGIPGGLEEVDRLTAGFQPGDFVVIGGRPSMGKTSLVLGAIDHAAEHGFPALMFSLEMRDQAQVERMLCTASLVDGHLVRIGRLQKPEWIALTHAASKLSVRPIQIDDRYRLTISELRTTARVWRARLPKKYEDKSCLVVIDYLQLVEGIEGTANDANRAALVARVSRGMKQLAREIRGTVVALSQLNRKLEERTDKRPMMSDLRESGALEQDADVIAFVYRDEVYSKAEVKDEDKGVAEVIVAKQRNGKTGTARCGWDASTMRFYNLHEDDPRAKREPRRAPAKRDDGYHPFAPGEDPEA